MATLYYRARSYYQYSYIWELYRNLGGQFIQGTSPNFELLQQKVGIQNSHLLKKTRKLSHQYRGVILEMTLPRRNYLKKSKNYRYVLVYHAMGSDESFRGRHFPVTRYDYYFVSGQKDRLKYKHNSYGFGNFEKRVVPVGHLRSDLIINGVYQRKQVLDKLNIQNRNRQNILFTPTWKKGHGTLLDTYEKFCTLIPREHNLLIRTHPYDLKNYAIVADYIQNNHIENVYLINSNEIDIIENMAAADLLIGGNSSVMYDWVFYNKPLIFVQNIGTILETATWATQAKFNIFNCGYTYNPDDDNIMELINHSLDQHPFAEQLEFLKDNTFYYNDGHANERAADWIKDQLAQF
ncbi:MAG: CDP-glycerol glycerophosphotransferase family protein [Candidatus Marinimicrobia bacterium]|nr:CDP-glycerol glycerophosphotransferase family protein [Candidatus Neomarinimicrobiota bacterium]